MSQVVTRDFVSKLLQERGKNFDTDYLAAKVHAKRMGKRRLSKAIDNYFEEIEFGKELKEIPKEYIKDVLSFCGYLAETKNKTFRIKGRYTDSGEETDKVIPYVHRWTEIYKKSILAKLWQLECVVGADLKEVTMITLTTYQRGVSPEAALDKLKESYKKLMECLRYAFGTTDFFYVLEPHKSGYPHIHMLYCKVLSKKEKQHVRELWSKKYEAASQQHGIKFSEPKRSKNGFFEAGSVGRIRGYLMKYIKKSVYKPDEVIDSYNGVVGNFGMEKYELLFNALLKKTKTRLWNCSRNFSKIMKRPEKEKGAWECTEVSQYYKDELVNIIWSKEGGSRPELMKSWEPVAITPVITKFDEERQKKGQIKIEYSEKDKKYYIFESVWIPVGCV